MNKFYRLFPIYALSLLVALQFAPSADAQLLNKLSKGINKINKGLEKVNQGLSSFSRTSSDHTQNYNINNEKEETIENTANSDNLEKSLLDEVKSSGAVVPYVTPGTKILYKSQKNDLDEVVPVSEGIFATYETNPKYGYSYYLGFYTLDGKRLTENRYQCVEGKYPIFDNGAVVLKDLPNGKRNDPFIILYKDGTARRLPESYSKVSQFHDGVAVVQEGQNGFCIDTKGNKIWPHLSSSTACVLSVGPVCDGLRRVETRYTDESSRYPKYQTRIGFIDNSGNWIIKPTYELTSEFKNGYCKVQDFDKKEKFIDTKGNTVLDLSNRKDESMSDFISEGYFIRRDRETLDKPTYFNFQGEALESFDIVSDFHDGYAFVSDNEKFGGYPRVMIVDKDFEVVGSLGSAFWNHTNTPFSWMGAYDIQIGEAGLITLSKKYIVTPKGELKIYLPDQSIFQPLWNSELGHFSPGRYAPVRISFDDEQGSFYGWDGYINENGEFEVVITDDDRAFRKLPGEEEGGVYKVNLTPVDTIPIGPKFLN